MGVIHRRNERGWDGFDPQRYDDPALAGVLKHELHCFEALDERPRGFVCVVGPRDL